MVDGLSYGTLVESSHNTLEFVVNGRLQQSWKVSAPITSMADLVQRCLTSLGSEGWRPISHQSSPPGTVVLARVPYTAGSKLSTYGTLRFLDDGSLVLTVSGAVMQRWQANCDFGGDAPAERWRSWMLRAGAFTVVIAMGQLL